MALRRTAKARRIPILVLVLILGGCAAPNLTSPGAIRGGSPHPSLALFEPSPSESAAPVPPSVTSSTPPTAPPPTASCPARTLASLTVAQRIGQLFVIGLTDDRLTAAERAAIARYHFGSVSFTTQTAAGVVAIRGVSDAVQAQATRAATGSVRFFVAANQEGGLIQALSGPGFDRIPSALVQGTLAPTVLRQDALRWGRQLRAAGVNLDFAPVADVVPPGTDATNAPIGELQREYGHDPTTAAADVAAFVAGMRRAGVATTAKHFPGLGRVVGNTDVTGDVVDAVTTRHDPSLAPFAAAVRAGTPLVMVSLATYERIDPTHLAVFSRVLIDGLLRGDLRFDGVVISDALGATAVASIQPGARALDFLAAGGDLIISNQLPGAEAMAAAIASAAAASRAFRRRVDAAAMHVLAAKQAAGLLPCG